MMPRRRSRLRPNPVQRGFTLIEILVVVVIAAIVSSIVIMSMNVVGDDRDLQQETYRMASLLELAADEATLQGRDFGLELTRKGYRFVEFDPFTTQWNELIGDDTLRPRELSDGLEFELIIEDRRVQLSEIATAIQSDEDDEGRDQLDDYAPHALLLSSGDITPFNLTIVRLADDVSLQLRVLPNGEIRTGSEEADFEDLDVE